MARLPGSWHSPSSRQPDFPSWSCMDASPLAASGYVSYFVTNEMSHRILPLSLTRPIITHSSIDSPHLKSKSATGCGLARWRKKKDAIPESGWHTATSKPDCSGRDSWCRSKLLLIWVHTTHWVRWEELRTPNAQNVHMTAARQGNPWLNPRHLGLTLSNEARLLPLKPTLASV